MRRLLLVPAGLTLLTLMACGPLDDGERPIDLVDSYVLATDFDRSTFG